MLSMSDPWLDKNGSTVKSREINDHLQSLISIGKINCHSALLTSPIGNPDVSRFSLQSPSRQPMVSHK